MTVSEEDVAGSEEVRQQLIDEGERTSEGGRRREGEEGGEGGGERPGGGGFPRRRGFGFKPVKVGEELDIKIMGKGEKGDGIAKVKGLVLFVPGGEVGQDVKVKITKVFKNFAVGEIVV